MSDNNIRSRLERLRIRTEIKKMNGYNYTSPKNADIENSYFNDLRFEVCKTIIKGE